MDPSQLAAVMSAIGENMELDKYGLTSIRNIYLDDPSFILARRSIERPLYKEKLRFRSYGPVGKDGKVFVELKKKYDGVVYKRRLRMGVDDALEWFSDPDAEGPDTQIGREIDFMRRRYPGIRPAMFLSYDRKAYYADGGGDFRVTIDSNIRSRTDDVDLRSEPGGFAVLPENYTLMEIKTLYGYPMWMTKVLGEQGLYKSSFSKYGNAYKEMVLGREPEEFYFLDRKAATGTY